MDLSKKTPLLLTVGAALLIILGGAGIWGLVRRRDTLSRDLPIGATAIPQDTVLALSFSTNEAQWRRLRQYGNAETNAQFDQFLAQWRDRLFGAHNLSFKQDIQPWVGSEVTVAFLTPSTSGVSPSDPPLLPEDIAHAVALLPIEDGAKTQEILLANAAGLSIANSYKGVDIYTLSPDADSLYGAQINGHLLAVGRQVDSVEQVIDAHKSGQSLADQPGFSRAFEALGATNPFIRIYMDMPAAARSLAARSEPPLPINLAAFSQPRGLAGTLTLETRGVQFQGISWLDSSTDISFSLNPQSGQLLQLLPSDTLLMVSNGNFQEFWRTYREDGRLGALLAFDPNDLALGLETATGLNMEEDLLPWMAGEAAIAVLKPPSGPPAEAAPEDETPPLPNPALVVMAQVSDRPRAEGLLTRLDAILTDRYRYTVDASEIGNRTLTRLVSPLDGLTLAHGWLGEDVVFLTLGEGASRAVIDAANRPLSTSSLFQLTTGQAPRPNNGHFFINLDGINAAQGSLLLPPLPEDGLITSDAIEAIGVTATPLADRQMRYDLFIALSRGDFPGPLPELNDEEASSEANEEAPSEANN